MEKTDTPETNKFRASLDGMREINQRDKLLSHARKLERERDDLLKRLREEQRLHVVTLDERDAANLKIPSDGSEMRELRGILMDD